MTRAGSVALKICGITRPDDLELCQALGIEAVGINLWAQSSRGLTLRDAKRLVERVPKRGAATQRVGVFVDATPDEVARAHTELELDALQLHGDREVEPYAALGIPWIWVVRGTPSLETVEVPRPAPLWILLDAHIEGYGGQGRRTDWAWAARAVRALAPVPVWLAGGITPENAADAIEQVAPAGLDVATGAELSPGHKDRNKIDALLRVCRGA